MSMLLRMSYVDKNILGPLVHMRHETIIDFREDQTHMTFTEEFQSFVM